MTEPKRWLESGEAPKDFADLLSAARPPRALDSVTKARSRRRLAAMTALPAAAGVMFWIKSVALGAVLGSVVTASVVAIKWPERQSTTERVPEARSNKPARAVVPVAASAALEPEPEPALSAQPRESPSAVASAARPATVVSSASSVDRPSPPVPDEATQKLEREIQLLERARQIMNANPTLALSTLDQHRREFGSGTLMLERQFLEVEALLRLGRRDQALARAADLRARAPGSFYERRLTQLIDSRSLP